jgi:hypothetical protein
MADTQIERMSQSDRVAESMRRALPYMPAEMRNLFEGMLRPDSIAIVTGTLIAWAGSHLFGVGEIVDIILVGIGVVSLGFAVFEGRSRVAEICIDRPERDFVRRLGRRWAASGASCHVAWRLHSAGAAVARSEPCCSRAWPATRVSPVEHGTGASSRQSASHCASSCDPGW